MNISRKNSVNLLDLPNEILLIIFNKLHMVDVLYSLVDVNTRLNQLILHPFYVRQFDVTSENMRSMFDRSFAVNNQVLDRICEHILPRIHHQVGRLRVEPHGLDRLLQTANYPSLYSLSLINFPEQTLCKFLKDHLILRHLLSEQITHLTIDVEDTRQKRPVSKIVRRVFLEIISTCTRLINLDFCDMHDSCLEISFSKLLSARCTSSTLTTLKMRVKNFDDCLYLLDGRFDNLSCLIIYTGNISSSSTNIKKKKQLPKLRHFSLSSFDETTNYDTEVIPLLRRMINLEVLELNLFISRSNSTYIDGRELHDEILIYMPVLTNFVLNIQTILWDVTVEKNLPSNEDIQHSFIGWKYGSVISYIENKSEENGASRCHIYSLPYVFNHFYYVDNSFSGAVFNNVRRLVMMDSQPFEYQFFKIISEHFPCLTSMYISNSQPQKDEQQLTTQLCFSRLIFLYIADAYDHYAEQFLVYSRCRLPRLLDLSIGYETLAKITNNFTNDVTRRTCAQLTRLKIEEPFVRTENFDEYFPLL